MLNSESIKQIKADIRQINGETGENVTIVAATKTVSADDINQLKNNGITIAGENRVQELLSKFDYVQGITWHFIGRLQTNKVKYIVDKVDMIQSLDRQNLADEIEKQCQKIDKTMDVLIEVNGGEDTKGGIAYGDVYNLADYVLTKPHLKLKGLMCIPSPCANEEEYKRLADLYGDFKKHYDGVEFLSLGMSNDYKIAVKYGANIIRPGRILFGDRVK